MKGALGNQFSHFAPAQFALGDGRIREFLPNLSLMTAFCALIFVNGHIFSPQNEDYETITSAIHYQHEFHRGIRILPYTWSDGVLEYWRNLTDKHSLFFLAYHSTTPLIQYSIWGEAPGTLTAQPGHGFYDSGRHQEYIQSL
jgi:hypothetical protein